MSPCHEVAVPSPVSFVEARSRPGDEETSRDLGAVESEECGTAAEVLADAHPTSTPSRDGTARRTSPARRSAAVEEAVRRR
jgi:hypothetical protein